MQIFIKTLLLLTVMLVFSMESECRMQACLSGKLHSVAPAYMANPAGENMEPFEKAEEIPSSPLSILLFI